MSPVAGLLAAARDRLAAEGAAAASGDVDAGTASPRLDAELLLAHVLGRDRVWLRAWPEASVDADRERHFHALVARRAGGEPIAYLLGQREFWSLPLAVAPGVLIPRPDTERLVELALELGPDSGAARALDLGTGSGAIAIALASERPAWHMAGIDVDPANVSLAAVNARRLQLANVTFVCGSWLEPIGGLFDLIVANPPYIAAGDPHLVQGDLRFEPRRALVADDDGLADLKTIICAAPRCLRPDAWLLLEHGWQQAPAVAALLEAGGFRGVSSWRDYAGHGRVSGGRWHS